MDFATLSMNCGSSVSPACAGVTVPMTPAGFQLAVGEIVAAATFLLGAGSQMLGSDLTFNQMRAVNSLRCAVTSLGDNFWNFIAAIYYGAKEFGYDNDVKSAFDQYFPYICTCNEDADNFAKFFGGNAATNTVMSACTEAAQQQAADIANRNSTNSTTTA